MPRAFFVSTRVYVPVYKILRHEGDWVNGNPLVPLCTMPPTLSSFTARGLLSILSSFRSHMSSFTEHQSCHVHASASHQQGHNYSIRCFLIGLKTMRSSRKFYFIIVSNSMYPIFIQKSFFSVSYEKKF